MAEIDNLVINVEVKGDTDKLGGLADDIDNIGKRSAKSTSKLARFSTSIKKLITSSTLAKASKYISDAVLSSMEYTESMNLFTVAMGDYAKEAQKYAESVSEVMGIDPAEWLKAQGTFNILATGFGVTADKAAIMSKNLTQLGYDIASFYNKPVEDAMLKLQSGLAGELEPLRRLGYDLSVARLQQEAYALGIDKSITSMTQAEKSMLRYHAIMTQVTEVQGDMARTLDSPANQTRIFKAQIDQLTRSIGNTLIPLINKLLPYMIALAQVAREAADSIAAFFGYSLPEVDFSSANASVGNIASDLEDANSSAKELKRTLMGFDEINKLNDTSSGASSDVGGGAGFDMDLYEYDFLGDRLAQDLDEVKQKLEDIMPLVASLGALFATWKLSSLLKDTELAEGRLQALKYASAITLTVTGIVVEWKGVISAFKNGLNKSNFGEIAAGAVLTVIGGALLGKLIPSVGVWLGAGVAALVAGIPAAFIGIYDAIANEMNGWNATLTALGLSLAGAGIGSIIAGPIGAGIGAIAGLVTGLCVDIGIIVGQKWDEITKFFEPAAEWFRSNVTEPISSFFGIAWSDISWLATETWDEISSTSTENWQIIKDNWNQLSGWFNANVVEPISTAFSDLWTDISTWASDTWKEIKNVFQPVGTFFSNMWNNTIKPKFIEIGTKIGESVSSAFKTAINGALWVIEGVLNTPIKAINGLLDVINKVPGISLTKLDTFVLPRLAEGGQVAAGQMFIAREAGPELVGSIGRKTTVANNDQIVDGIYRGVYQAMRDAGTGNGGGQTVVVMLPNGDVLGEAFVDWHNGVVKQTGTSPLYV